MVFRHRIQRRGGSIKRSKHDQFVDDLVHLLKDNYDHIDTNVTITNKKRSLGEIDVIAKKGRRLDIFEVKCSYRIKKAEKQLRRIDRLLNEPEMNIRHFFYCGASRVLEPITIN